MEKADFNYVKKNVEKIIKANWKHSKNDGFIIIGRMSLDEKTLTFGKSKGTEETITDLIIELMEQLPDNIVTNVVTRASKKRRGKK